MVSDSMSSYPIVQQDIETIVRVVGSNLNRLQGKRLLITGGTGFVGTWLLETIGWLNDKWERPCIVYVPTRNPQAFAIKAPHLATRSDIFFLPGDISSFEYPDHACDYIIHSAAPAEPQIVNRNLLDVSETIVNGTRRVLELASRKQVESFMFVSSGAVYGSQPSELERIPENYLGAPDITNPRSAYGEAKRYGEVLCALYFQERAVPVRIARPFTFVGCYQNLDSGFAVTDFIKNSLCGLSLVIQGDGTTVRSYCYGADLTVALLKILLGGRAGRAYNVGSEDGISIRELAQRIIAITGATVEINITQATQAGRSPARYVPDISRLRTELDYEPQYGLDESLKRTINWAQSVCLPSTKHESHNKEEVK
jgi:nucleoside-diphosphate-sugar epimerase